MKRIMRWITNTEHSFYNLTIYVMVTIIMPGYKRKFVVTVIMSESSRLQDYIYNRVLNKSLF